MRRRTPRHVLLVVLAALALLGVGLHPASAATPTGTISGTVKGADGKVLTHADVVLATKVTHSDGSVEIRQISQKHVTSTGSYSFAVTPATYRIEFLAGDTDYLNQWFDGQPDDTRAPDPVPVTAGRTTKANGHLPLAGHIAGVESVEGGIDDDGSFVDAPIEALVPAHGTNPFPDFRGSAVADSDGSYDIGGLPTGDYVVSFPSPDETHTDRYSGGSYTLGDATTVHVEQGMTTSLSAVLPVGGTITGMVTSGDGAAAGAAVDALDDGSGYLSSVRSAEVGSAGTYTIRGLPPGEFTVRFDDYVHPTQYFDDSATVSGATKVAVQLGASHDGVDAVLHTGATLRGTVTVPSGVTDDNATNVRLVDAATGEVVRSGADTTSAKGAYYFGSLPAGSYRVEFARTDAKTKVAGQYFRGVTEGQGADAAELVVLHDGEDRTGVDATLALGGSITGTLLDRDGKPAQCYVHAYTADGHLVGRQAFSSATTGNFAIHGLSAGQYLIAVNEDHACAAEGAARYYDLGSPEMTSSDAAAADPVSVTLGGTTALPKSLYVRDLSRFTTLPTPTITGTPANGATLTAHGGHTDPVETTRTFQWTRDGVSIAGATAATYRLHTIDRGHTVSVVVTFKKPTYANTKVGPDQGVLIP